MSETPDVTKLLRYVEKLGLICEPSELNDDVFNNREGEYKRWTVYHPDPYVFGTLGLVWSPSEPNGFSIERDGYEQEAHTERTARQWLRRFRERTA